MMSKLRGLFHGVIAGVIGAIVLALWYLIFDAAAGRPLNTPSQYASVLFTGFTPARMAQTSFWALAVGHLFYYFAVFALVGLATAAIFEIAEAEKPWFPFVGVFCVGFEIFGIMIMMLLGPWSAASTPWYKFLIGDFMATAAMSAYFLLRHPSLTDSMKGQWTDVLREGTVAGIIGSCVCYAFFLIVDAASGPVLRTPANLGAAIFHGVLRPGTVQVTAPMVVGYTALQFFCFILFGILASAILYIGDREPLFPVLASLLLWSFEIIFIAAVAVYSRADVTNLMTFWLIVGGNILGVTSMIFYYWRHHPEWVPRLVQRWQFVREGNRG